MTVKIWKRELPKQSYDFLSFTAILDDRGRIVIPASIRKRLKIRFGSLVLAKVRRSYKICADGGKDVKI